MKMTKKDKQIVREQYEKVWRKRDGSIDEKMVDYCTKKASAYIEIDGVIVVFDKPHIETRFCFGEHGYDFDEVSEHCERMSKSEEYFINENMRWCQAANWLNQIDESPYGHAAYLYAGEYSSQTPDCKLGYIKWLHPWDTNGNEIRQLDEGEIEQLREIMVGEVEKFDKRLRTYLKRYGLSKCHFWTYWADR